MFTAWSLYLANLGNTNMHKVWILSKSQISMSCIASMKVHFAEMTGVEPA